MKTPIHSVKTLNRRVRDNQPYWHVRKLINWRSTGVKDKHGREIYEGDKLQFSGGSIDGKIYTVVFTEGCFRINDAEDGTPLFWFSQADCMEVVGHIAEDITP